MSLFLPAFYQTLPIPLLFVVASSAEQESNNKFKTSNDIKYFLLRC
jgi:hypothetical protein